MKHINKNCNHCGVDLVLEENYAPHRLRKKDYICKDCYQKNIVEQKMYVNGKYIAKSHPLHKAGRYKTFEGAAFSSLKGYETTDEGYVYIITNPCWKGWIKVGMAIDAKDRCNQYQTSSPFRDYELHYSKFFSNRKVAEQIAHKLLKKNSEKKKGEWFKISKQDAKNIIETI